MDRKVSSFLSDSPYKGLMPYDEEDVLFFFGRERWRDIIINNLKSSRLTILYGESGVGKSSVLRAGVAHSLNQSARYNFEQYGSPGYAVTVFNAWRDDPLPALLRQLETDIKQLFIGKEFQPVQPSGSLVQTLQAWADLIGDPEVSGQLFIILDQFEEYFTYHPNDTRGGTFADEFAKAVNCSNLPINFLISLREDSLARLDFFKRRIPNLFRNLLRIEHLDQVSARDAIVCPLAEYNRQQVIIKHLITERLTILSGDSGVGKTLILESGVAHRLRQAANVNWNQAGGRKFAVVFFNRWWPDPLTGLIHQVELDIPRFLNQLTGEGRRAYQQKRQQTLSISPHLAGIDNLRGGMSPDKTPELRVSPLSLVEVLRTWTERLGGTLFIMLDQFEQYLQDQAEAKDGRTFGNELLKVLQCPDLNVHFLLCIRQAALDRLVEYFKDVLPDVLPERYLSVSQEAIAIEPFSPQAVKEGSEIALSVSREETFSIAADLVETVLTEVTAGQSLLGKSGWGGTGKQADRSQDEGTIEAPYLQLVMIRLWQEERKLGSSSLRLSTLNQLGGSRQIVQEHLNEQMALLQPQERAIAARIFQYLVTPAGTKIAYPVMDLAKQAEINPTDLNTVLEKLGRGDLRILRRVGPPLDQPDAGERYEIFHDVLAPAILDWQQRQKRQEALAKRQRKFVEILLATGAVFAGITLVQSGQLLQSQKQFASSSQQANAITALQQFESSQLDGLLTAMQAAQEAKRQDLLESTPMMMPTLQQMLGGIQEQNRLQSPSASPLSRTVVAFSPQKDLLVSAQQDGTLILSDQNGKTKSRFATKQRQIWWISFSPDGQWIVTRSEKGTQIWTLDGRKVHNFQQVRRVNFSPNGQQIATVSTDNTASLWDLQGQRLATFRGPENTRLLQVALSPKGDRVVTGGSDGMLRLWDVQGRKLSQIASSGGRIWSVVFSPDGQRLVSGGEDGTARLWDLQGKLLAILKGHEATVYDVCFSPDGQTIATASRDGTARLWDLAGKPLARLPHQSAVYSVDFSDRGNQLITSTADGKVHFWQVQQQRNQFRGSDQRIYRVSFSPDGQKLATASQDGTVTLGNLKGDKLFTFPKGKSKDNSPVYFVAFSPDGQQLAIASEDGIARLLDLQGNLLREFKGHKRAVYRLSFSPNGQLLATASADRTARLWSLTGQEQAVLKGHERAVTQAIFSPDGQKLVTGGFDGTARLWNLQGKQLTEFKAAEQGVIHVAFSPDGQSLATASGDGTVRLWDVRGNPRGKLTGHTTWVTSVSFSPDGQQLATASADGTARLWDVQKNSLISEFKGYGGSVWSASFSPDGKQLATSSDDGIIRLWPIESFEELMARGCKWLEDYFAAHPNERQQREICLEEQ
jgi:WD40 repeat protein